MKALLDEQLSPLIGELLRGRGHDVEPVTERRDLAGRSDQSVLEVASTEDRAVITNNLKDFRPFAAERLAQGQSYAGLILLPSKRARTPSATASLVNATERILLAHPDGLRSAEQWVPPVE
ncbi:MAG: DUF5615 family PIN-like protein [Gaiellaceae bacterium]